MPCLDDSGVSPTKRRPFAWSQQRDLLRIIVWTQKQDPVRALADELRGRRGMESRQGILGTERVDYFR